MGFMCMTSRSLQGLIVATFLMVLPFLANAQVLRTIQPRFMPDGSTVFVDATDDPAPQLGSDRLWDNWTGPIGGGRTFVGTSIIPVGSLEIGEVCIGVAGRGGVLSDLGFGLANMSTTQTLQQMRVTNRVYTLEGTLLFTFSVFAPFLPHIQPGERLKYHYGEGTFLGTGIEVPDNVICTVQFSELGNFDPANLGLLVGTPITAGTGDGLYYNRTLNQMIALPSAQENLLMKVHTLAIPSPSSASLLVASCFLALQRRRSAHTGC